LYFENKSTVEPKDNRPDIQGVSKILGQTSDRLSPPKEGRNFTNTEFSRYSPTTC
jgi:hypothetical protein